MERKKEVKSRRMKIKEKIEQGYLHVSLIIEMLGRPADFVETTLKKVIENFSKEKGIEILHKEISKPKEIKNWFSCFADLEILVINLRRLLEIMFDYLPSSVEIIEPQNLKISLADANTVLNDLLANLHKYDSTTKSVKLENMMLKKRLGIQEEKPLPRIEKNKHKYKKIKRKK